MSILSDDFFKPDVDLGTIGGVQSRTQMATVFVTAFLAFGSIAQPYASVAANVPPTRVESGHVWTFPTVTPNVDVMLSQRESPLDHQPAFLNEIALLDAGEKVKKRARTVLSFGERNGMAPDRVVPSGEGNVVFYWFSEEKLSDGASERFSMLTITKDRMSILLKDRVTRAALADIVRIPELATFITRLRDHVRPA